MPPHDFDAAFRTLFFRADPDGGDLLRLYFSDLGLAGLPPHLAAGCHTGGSCLLCVGDTVVRQEFHRGGLPVLRR